MWNKISEGGRHHQLEVCEDEQSKMAFARCVTYEIDDQGNDVEVAFEEIMRVKIGVQGIFGQQVSEAQE